MDITLSFSHLLTRDGILHDQQLELDGAGRILRISPASGSSRDGWLALPGMPDAHSHVFQRALAGHGEQRTAGGGGEESFWSWREAMYRLAAGITPEDLQVIARQGFIEMLRGGFTSVAEFHYLHHLPDGSRSTAMAEAVAAAADEVGIRLRLLPVAYFQGGFGQQPQPGQQRFVHRDIDEFMQLLDGLAGLQPGIAPHSLRAVEVSDMGRLLAAAGELLGDAFPVHIHVAEQEKEITDCQAHYGKHPVELLADNVELGPQWNLVHATHVNADEQRRILEADSNVVLCPITEAYLGDGLFPATEFAAAGGHMAIGSDSNCHIDAFEELRWLEFGQRLRDRRRARLADGNGLQRLYAATVDAGARALQLPVSGIAPGQFADLLVIGQDAPALRGHAPESALDALIINGGPADVAAVYVAGRLRVSAGEHPLAAATAAAFHDVVRRLLG